jgi:hypothetical protein
VVENNGISPLRLALIAGAGLALVIVAMILYAHRRYTSADSPSSLSDEQRAYLGQVGVSDARMSAAENFLGHTITYLDGTITNRGTRAVSQVQLEMEFVDVLGQVVLRETARPVNLQTPALEPGQSRPFQVPFEHMPFEWNQAPPKTRVKLVTFQ